MGTQVPQIQPVADTAHYKSIFFTYVFVQSNAYKMFVDV